MRVYGWRPNKSRQMQWQAPARAQCLQQAVDGPVGWQTIGMMLFALWQVRRLVLTCDEYADPVGMVSMAVDNVIYVLVCRLWLYRRHEVPVAVNCFRHRVTAMHELTDWSLELIDQLRTHKSQRLWNIAAPLNFVNPSNKIVSTDIPRWQREYRRLKPVWPM